VIDAIHITFQNGIPRGRDKLRQIANSFTRFTGGELWGCVSAIDGWVCKTKNLINLRLEMLWHIKIIMVAESLLPWLCVMLIAITTVFLECIVAQLMTALHGISVRPVKWWSILIGLQTSLLLAMKLLFAQITFDSLFWTWSWSLEGCL
jgi:hypothetical protein